MKAVTKIVFYDENDEKFFGEGPTRLLRGVERTGSLRAASAEMNMAYTKALKLVRNAETALGFSLITSVAGGKSGGGSVLTEKGKKWLTRYETYRDACIQANRQLYLEHFPEQAFGNIGCVIMASGLGTRFGGNKLLADFNGQPMICRILDATEGIFTNRVVVTRHKEIAQLCQLRGIHTVLHELPSHNDTIRLGLETLTGIERCMFCPGDQPLLRQETIASLVLASAQDPDSIWRTAYEDTPGSPVVFPSWAFPELRNLPEGKGGGYIIKNNPNKVKLLQVKNPFELKDIDTPEDLEELAQISG